MATIPLRAYDREIEQLIEKGEHDQAIAHCKHVLKYFPKHIDTYRLLGKAYLECQRYGDASDIFQRVLSSIPEDFVSHVGMSIIREDEGNLDEALWHMERAFEMQPANSAVQNELKRLCGRRDGIEPPKINLTRGALARMYLKGGLYQQAIAELRVSLAEDPERLDLQALLARAYYLAGLSAEAAETSNILLNKLPYCFEINAILAEITAQSKGTAEATEYRNRMYALNPYSAHLTATAKTPDMVPEAAITIEKLDWTPGSESGSSTKEPTWASIVGVEISETESKRESIPDWLSSSKETDDRGEQIPPESPGSEIPEQISPQTEESDMTIAEQPPVDSIPTWMQEAGWETVNGVQEKDTTIDFKEEEVETENLEPAEIPDWLKSLAPTELEEEQSLLPETSFADTEAPWQEPSQAGTSEDITPFLEEKSVLSDEISQAQPLPAPLVEGESSEMKTPDLGLPDWLKELDNEPSEENFAEELEPLEDQAELELPDWLKTDRSEKPEGVRIPEPDVTPELTPQSFIVEPPIEEEDTKPVRLVTEVPIDLKPPIEVKPKEQIEELPEWIKELTEQEEVSSAGLAPEEIVSTEASTAQIGSENLDFLSFDKPEEAGQIQEVPAPFEELETESLPEQPAAESLIAESEIQPQTSEETTPDVSQENLEETISGDEAPAEAEIPTWVMEYDQTYGDERIQPAQQAQAEMPEEELEEVVEFPEWLSDFEKEQAEAIPESEHLPPEETPVSETAIAFNEETPSFPEQESGLSPKSEAFGPVNLNPVEPTETEVSMPEDATPIDEFDAYLIQAREELQQGQKEEALTHYGILIKSNRYLAEVIADLNAQLSLSPLDIPVWTSLGDAYLRSNQLDFALEAYNKAEELLR